jgi:1-aminocyclopropane-1-carboxylate deaminase/D-cysteine desulfhydrase-like pyridoxal-dependent ACC family enzyme
VVRLELGSYPTPVERIRALSTAASELWVKRDDLTSDVYGGNKVRKLELFFGAAREAGKSRILTIGAAGSHQVVATAIFGARHGFEVEAVLVPQPGSAHARENLRVAVAHGLRANVAPAWALGPPLVMARLARRRGDTFFIPLGGSSPLGTLAFVDAGRELAAQVRAGQMPEPDVAVVALGSGGTAAGLAVAFEETGLRTRVVGVAVSRPVSALAAMARRLAGASAVAAKLSADVGERAARRLEVTSAFLGKGYGHATRAGEEATAAAAALPATGPARVAAAAGGLALDATYTAKAFACALDRVRDGSDRTVLYWHTLSSAPLDPRGVARAPLEARLERAFR